MSSYQDRLWGELLEHHGSLLADPAPFVLTAPAPARRVRRRLVPIATALALVLAAVLAIELGFNSGGGVPAYAVTRNADGTITITLRELLGVPGANAKLETLGVPVRVVPIEATCPIDRSAYSPVPLPRGGEGPIYALEAPSPAGPGLRVDPSAIPQGDTFVIEAGEISSGAFGLDEHLYRGAVPPCFPPLATGDSP